MIKNCAPIFTAIVLSISSAAFADFPADNLRSSATAAVSHELLTAKTPLNVKSLKMRAEGFSVQHSTHEDASVLSSVVSRSEVDSNVLVRIPFSQTTAGGGEIASLTVEVRVDLITDPDTGDFKSRQVKILNSSIQEHRILQN